jgi:hypothetical protein
LSKEVEYEPLNVNPPNTKSLFELVTNDALNVFAKLVVSLSVLNNIPTAPDVLVVIAVKLKVAAVAANAALPVAQFSIPLMTIFNLTNNYVPCWALTSSSLRLEIQWASSVSQFINYPDNRNLVPLANTTTIFNDVSLTCNFMELSDSARALIQNSLQGRPVEWVVSNYANYIFNTTLPDAITNVSMAVPAKFNSLKSLLFTFRPTGSASGTGTAFGSGLYGSQSLKSFLLLSSNFSLLSFKFSNEFMFLLYKNG